MKTLKYNGDNLKERRLKKKLRHIDLAKKVGVSSRSINRYEHEYGYPPSNTLKKLGKVLKVNWLINCEEE